MARDCRTDYSDEVEAGAAADDDFLIASLRGGDAAALGALMDRYDRLVRFAIFRASKSRCRQDPQWLDSMASQTWEGFLQSVCRQPETHTHSLQAYLIQIARNKVTSAQRHRSLALDSRTHSVEIYEAEFAASLETPSELAERLELLEVLQGCLSALPVKDRKLASQLPAIMERKWNDAAQALGMKESTLRSHWKRVLGLLRSCLEQKGKKTFAPGGSNIDAYNGRC